MSLDSGPHSRLYDFVMAANHQTESTAMQIGDVAKRTSLTVDAIRFYEKRKLLPKAVRSADLLRSRATVSPDFSSVAVQCANGIMRLTPTVGVLEQMDVVLGRLGKKLAQGVRSPFATSHRRSTSRAPLSQRGPTRGMSLRPIS
jgi:hypothetical protein